MKDLSGNAWMYSHYCIPYKGDASKEKFDNGFSAWRDHYIIAQLNVDNNGNYVASNVSTGELNFSAAEDQYSFQNEGGKADYLAFYIYITISSVHTYALNIDNLYAPVKKLAENDVEIKIVAEFNF